MCSADTSYGDWERYRVKTLCQYLRGRGLGFEEFRDGESCIGRGMLRFVVAPAGFADACLCFFTPRNRQVDGFVTY